MRVDVATGRSAPLPLRRGWQLPRPSRRLWLIIAFVGFAAQVAWRLYLSLPLTGPVVHDDEDGYLFAARILAGGPQATLPLWSIMRPMGYPLVVAPVYVIVQQPDHVYAGVHIINALLTAANFPLLYVLGRRLFHTGRGWTAAVAFAAAALPSIVFYSEYALTDALLPVLLLGFLLAVHMMLSGGRRAVAGAVAGAIAGYAANTHVRGLVLLMLLGAVVLIGRWRRWLSWSTAVAAAVSAVVVYGLGYLLDGWLETQLFPGSAAYQPGGRIIGRLTTPAGLFRVVADGLGQIWYLCTSTYGLAGLGLAAVVVALLRREGSRDTRVVLGLALAANLGIAFATATGIPDEGRINNHFYGRYVALFAGLWTMVAIISLARARWRRSAGYVAGAVAIELGTLAVVWLYAHQRFRTEVYVGVDAPELGFLSHDYKHMHLRSMTLLAIAFMVLFAALFTAATPSLTRTRTRRRGTGRALAATAGLVGLLSLNLIAMRSITNWISIPFQQRQYQPGPAQLVRDAHVPVGSSVALAANVPWKINQRQQREVYWAPMTPFAATGGPAGAPTYVVSLASWPGDQYGYQARYTFQDPDATRWTVWQRR
jgi:hypothetical protein